MSAPNGCTGKCCESFGFPNAMGRDGTADLVWAALSHDGEAPFIADMLQLVPETPYTFRCRHHDAGSGLCTIYDRRPRMCSEYPDYGRRGYCLLDNDCTFEFANLAKEWYREE